ncbi:Scr1 family TA system antitoxin-like transcriptional regulator [Streptomyces sp. NPDC050400]|uniref:helix-turn-helix domain-containing protein n=1 Tax=Streptomyces sp. NPDC050400 TaxID=3365610 RepID=UPI0037BBB73C
MTSRQAPRKRNISTMKMVGRQLKAARQAAGHTQAQLAALVQVDDETIASVEQGRRVLQLELAERLDELLHTKGVLVAAAENMPELDQLPQWADEYLRQEREALVISSYNSLVFPGILQTEEYARCVFRQRVPAYIDEELEAKTASRVARHEILQRKGSPTMSYVVWEPVLHMAMGGPQVRRNQLEYVRQCAELPHVTLQFLPLDSLDHAGLSGGFSLLENPDHQHIAYTESQLGTQLVSDPESASRMARKYAMLRTQALTAQQSIHLLERVLGEL